jgi:hypothetical protein
MTFIYPATTRRPIRSGPTHTPLWWTQPLGPFNPPGGGPSYVEVAQQHRASYFDIGEAWNSFTPTEQLAANQHVLDIAIANRDKITLTVPFDMIEPDTYTAAEIRYLELHGYRQVNDTTWAPPVGGTK